MKTISICLPTYNKEGSQHNENYNNITMLLDLFTSLQKQTYKDYELVVSDHSTDDSIKNVCDKWKEELNIRYYRFEEKYGSCEANLNNAIKKAEGKYIKPMLQDDYFHSELALARMVKELEENDAGWIVCGCVHIKENDHNGVYYSHTPQNCDEEKMLTGQNLIGSPIVTMYKNDGMLYDECLIWLMDVEFYYRMMKKYGKPTLIDDLLLVSRIRQDGISDTMINAEIRADEMRYCSNKKNVQLKDIKDYSAIYERVTKNGIVKTDERSSYKINDFCSEFIGIIKEVRPQLIVEFGILEGYSLQAFIDGRSDSCEIHAYDLFEDFPFNAADYNKIKERFSKYQNLKIKKLDFYKGYKKYKKESIDILHIDIANNGDVFKFAIDNYMSKIKRGGAIVLEGGSMERDQVEWMGKFNKTRINPYLESIKNKFNIRIIDKFPSLTIIKKK